MFFTINLVLQAREKGIVRFASTSSTFLSIKRSRVLNVDGIVAVEEAVHPLLTKQPKDSSLREDLLRHSRESGLRWRPCRNFFVTSLS